MRKADVLTVGLPQSEEAERLVLGSVINGGTEFRIIRNILSRSDFFSERHRRIWDAMEDLDAAGRECDRVSVSQALIDAGKLEGVGVAYVAALDHETPQIENVEGWARIVLDKASARRAIVTAQAVIDRCLTGSDSRETVEWAVGALKKSLSDPDEGDVPTVSEIVCSKGLESILNPGTRGHGLPLPWEKLSWLVPGLRPGQLVTIAARPGVGKSACAGQISVHAAMNGYSPVLFSMEMPSEDILRRMAAGMAEVSLRDIMAGKLATGERQRLAVAMARLAERDLRIFDRPNLSVKSIYSRLRKLGMRAGRGVVVVDYLQLMDAPGRPESRNQAISEMTRGLKNLAVEFGLPFVVLSQLSRDSEKQQRRPMLCDLRDSGSIEQDSDVVIFLHPVSNDEARHDVEFIVAKQRNGRRGKVTMQFAGEYVKFSEEGGD